MQHFTLDFIQLEKAEGKEYTPLRTLSCNTVLMKVIGTEIQKFVAASEYLRSSTMDPEELTKMEHDFIKYYLWALGKKFSSLPRKVT